MSYIRFDDNSDVYAYHSVNGTFVCHSCRMTKITVWGWYGSSVFKTLPKLEDHLIEHWLQGDKVPKHAFDNIEENP